jgi:ABC-type branched-subunit amino acid transport system ATPase component
MGKTALRKTIIGLVRASSGSIRMNGQDLTSLQAAQIARLGIGYVPRGRRLWRSLSVDEHPRLSAGGRRGGWSAERVYDTFPRLGYEPGRYLTD